MVDCLPRNQGTVAEWAFGSDIGTSELETFNGDKVYQVRYAAKPVDVCSRRRQCLDKMLFGDSPMKQRPVNGRCRARGLIDLVRIDPRDLIEDRMIFLVELPVTECPEIFLEMV